MANGWTAKRRARQAQAIWRWRPWEHSTGPRTPEGKARVSRNAYRGGKRQEHRAFVRALNAMLGTQAQQLSDIARSFE
jgi:hypothetical protein